MKAGVNFGGLGFLVQNYPWQIKLGSNGIMCMQTIINDAFMPGDLKPKEFTLIAKITSPHGKEVTAMMGNKFSGTLSTPAGILVKVSAAISIIETKIGIRHHLPEPKPTLALIYKAQCAFPIDFKALRQAGFTDTDLTGRWTFRFSLNSPGWAEPKVRTQTLPVV
jgi:hypothetical protein